MEDPQGGQNQSVFGLCTLEETTADFPARTATESPLFEAS